jgi:hypothetical protein
VFAAGLLGEPDTDHRVPPVGSKRGKFSVVSCIFKLGLALAVRSPGWFPVIHDAEPYRDRLSRMAERCLRRVTEKMSQFVVRLWVHDAEDGLVPEIAVQADTQMQAAALALNHFIAINRSVAPDSYLQCEPCESRYLRVRDVTEWLETAEGRRFSIGRGVILPSFLGQPHSGTRAQKQRRR